MHIPYTPYITHRNWLLGESYDLYTQTHFGHIALHRIQSTLDEDGVVTILADALDICEFGQAVDL